MLNREKEKKCQTVFSMKKKKYINSINNKMAITTYSSKITLNVNGLNAAIKRHRVAEWIRKQDPHICYPDQETHTNWK